MKRRRAARPAKDSAEPPPSAPPGRSGRLGLVFGLLFLAAVLLPILQVAGIRFIDPPVTLPMLLRPIEASFDSQPNPERHYAWRPLNELPPEFVKYVLVAEDQRFFQHRGFDWQEMQLAREHAERTGEPVRGASTITMQCARSLFLWQGRSWIRKGCEAYYTFWMETILSKRRILELYVNVIELGDGAYGVEAAARQHYGKGARRLTREQCASLAALLPAPRQWDPKSPTPRFSAHLTKILAQEKTVTFPALERPRK